MAKTIIGTRFTGDLVGGIAGNVQIIEKVEYTDDDGTAIAVKDVTRPPNDGELTAILGAQLAAVAAENASLHNLNAGLQEDRDTLTASLTAANAEIENLTEAKLTAEAAAAALQQRLDVAVGTLVKVAQADASWDSSPRADVATVLKRELPPA